MRYAACAVLALICAQTGYASADQQVDLVERTRANQHEENEQDEAARRSAHRHAPTHRMREQDRQSNQGCDAQGDNEFDLILTAIIVPALRLCLSSREIGQQRLQIELLVDAQEGHDQCNHLPEALLARRRALRR